MQRSDYTSSFHYIVLQPSHAGFSFEDFLRFFVNKDIGKLDLAISDTNLRDAFHKRLGSFYDQNEISCVEELVLVSNRKHLSIVKFQAPSLSIFSKLQLLLILLRLLLLLLDIS